MQPEAKPPLYEAWEGTPLLELDGGRAIPIADPPPVDTGILGFSLLGAVGKYRPLIRVSVDYGMSATPIHLLEKERGESIRFEFSTQMVFVHSERADTFFRKYLLPGVTLRISIGEKHYAIHHPTELNKVPDQKTGDESA